MDAGNHPIGRGRSLVRRIAVALTATAVAIAVVLGLLAADWRDEARRADAAAHERRLANSLASRAGVHLANGDLLRLATVAAAVRDLAEGRALVLDVDGKVVIDTSLALGEQRLGRVAVDTPLQRTLTGDDDVAQRETAVPIRHAGATIGEARLHCPVSLRQGGFDVAVAGLALLVGLVFVVGALVCTIQWSTRVRSTTNALLRLAAGERASTRPGPDDDQEFCELAGAMRELERGMEDGLRRVSEGYVAMALQLVDGLERRLLAVPGHGERTARLARLVAGRLGFLPCDLRELDLACRLVDLGKAMIRPAILQKAGPLTEVEAESLRCHPVRAAELLECVPGLRPVGEIVRAQLERHDGKGGPAGLRGERIPLAARVLAVAAGFDLLTSCTPGQPMTWRQALASLREERGAAFDPRVVDTICAVVEASPPDDADRTVMLVPGGMLPWRAEPVAASASGADDEPEESAELDDEAFELLDDGREAPR